MADIIRAGLPFSTEDFARTCLIRILPRSRYRLAAQNDGRFQSFVNNTVRIAYRQQGATPSFLLFCGEGQNPHAAAMAAAAWAEASWRPNAIQRRVRPGVVAVHVAPGNQLTPAGPVAGAVVPATVWTVDSATGKVETIGNPPGSPPASEMRHAASSMMRGMPAPTLGELDLAERGVMQLRTTSMPRAFGGLLGLVLLFLAFRYGIAGLTGLFILPELLSRSVTGDRLALALSFGVAVLILAGIVFGLVLVFNFRNAAMRMPWFSSPNPSSRNVAWGGYVALMVALVVVQEAVVPGLQHHNQVSASQGQFTHVRVTAADDGSETYIDLDGDLTVDLSQWPSNEWAGVTFKTSNPSVLSLDATPSSGAAPIAKYSGHEAGAARVDASSGDGKYTFQIRVDVGSPPT
ncbi:MAG TPA: hypothetical protein VKE27_05675 [Candidatus Dormibacteraeota bacterium]|nr:hypothetical protein [Candidatus Dormibacteraeota bacterium]